MNEKKKTDYIKLLFLHQINENIYSLSMKTNLILMSSSSGPHIFTT